MSRSRRPLGGAYEEMSAARQTRTTRPFPPAGWCATLAAQRAVALDSNAPSAPEMARFRERVSGGSYVRTHLRGRADTGVRGHFVTSTCVSVGVEASLSQPAMAPSKRASELPRVVSQGSVSIVRSRLKVYARIALL